MRKHLLILGTLFIIMATSASGNPPDTNKHYDLIVYGSTGAGVGAAVNAGNAGLEVLLVEEIYQIGGMLASGMNHTDIRTFYSVSGTFREYMDRAVQHYKETYGADSPQVTATAHGGYVEPKVVNQIFTEMLAEAKVDVIVNYQLTNVNREGDRVLSATFVPADSTEGYPLPVEGGEPITYSADFFIDATYEGDLIAAAGIPYRVGMEPVDWYNEPDANPDKVGVLQGMNFRITLTNNPDNRMPIPEPAGYVREDYLPVLDDAIAGKLADYTLERMVMGPNRPLPNDKGDFNDRKGYRNSIKFTEPMYMDWPDGTPERRREIWNRIRAWNQGFFYFLANDTEFAQYAPHIASEAAEWGMPLDEFESSGHWPPLVYVREGRRMIGRRVLTQMDVASVGAGTGRPPIADAVAIGDYSYSFHGGMGTFSDGRPGGSLTGPYQVAYDALVPAEVENLLAPGPVSVSHIAFSRTRMEPVWTALGQAAGLAIAQAKARNSSVQEVSVPELQHALYRNKSRTFYIPDVPLDSEYFAAVQYWGTRGLFEGLDDPEGVSPYRENWNYKPPAQWQSNAWGGYDIFPDYPLDIALGEDWLAQANEASDGSIELNVTDLVGQGISRGAYLSLLYKKILPSGTTVSF